ncbi:MAG: hypothetical protein ACKOWF_04910 [Chloroflexota bacterium]
MIRQQESQTPLVDRLARAFATRMSRRAVAGAVVIAASAAPGALAEAEERCRPASMACSSGSQCCSRRCREGHCVNGRNARAGERRQSRKRRRRQDRRHDQRLRRKRRHRAQGRVAQPGAAGAGAYAGNVDVTVVNEAGRTLWFDLWQADGTGRDLALAGRVAGMLGGGQRSRKVRVAGGRAAATLRVTNDLGASDWLVEVRRGPDGSNVSLARGQASASGFAVAEIVVPRWDTRKADLAASPYTLDVPEDAARVTVLRLLDDGETVEITIEVRDQP